MKYVIIGLESETPRAYPFIFSERLTHSEVARWAQRAVEREFKKPASVLSAGFCRIHENQWRATHGSESLRIERDDRQGYKDYLILNQPNAMEDRIPA